MDVVSDIEVIESDVRDVEQKCQKVNCGVGPVPSPTFLTG